jgi:hypothetical protein
MQTNISLAAVALLAVVAGCGDPNTNGSAESGQHREQRSTDLADLISSGEVLLVQASGNGASSGNSVDAVLKNNTGHEIEVDVYMRKPIFLTNRGAGQNMIASMIVGADGGYLQSGDRFIVALNPGEHFKASIIAYCADFEKENPTAAERFVIVQQVPAHFARVIARINAYARANPNANVTSAAQVAIWMAQGKNLEEIAHKFEFTPSDAQLANMFIGGAR